MTHDLVEIAWKSVIASGLALLLLALLRNRSAAERSWIAHAGLVATLLLPLAVFNMPRWEVEAPASMPNVLVAPPAASSVTPAASVLPDRVGPEAAAAGTSAFSADTVLPWLYALPAALLLLVTLVAVIRLFALRGRAAVLVEPSWLSALAHAQRRMGFKHGTALLVSNELASPVSWGILRPIILLNEAAVKSASEAEAIIAHELAHVARLDWAKLLIARAATALFWFNPLVWLLARQCHQLREEAADDAVLRSDVVCTDYAALLVGAARHESKGLLLAANGVAPGPGSLKRRVTRVLNTTLSRRPAPVAWAAACSVGALLISAPLAALAPVNPLPAAIAGIPVLSSLTADTVPAPPSPVPAPAAAPIAPAGMPPSPHAPVLAPLPTAPTAVVPSAIAPAAAVQPSQGRRSITPDQLVAMSIHGVTPAYVNSLAAVDPKYANLSPDQLVAMRIHGISAERVRGLAELGYRNIAHNDLIGLGIHGVTPAFIREVHEAGYRGLSVGQLTAMRIHGVSPSFIKQMADLGYRRLSVDQLTAMRIHGVTPEYVREFRAAGYDDLTANELVNMRIHGVRMNGIEKRVERVRTRQSDP